MPPPRLDNFSHSYKLGVAIDVSRFVSIEVFKRSFFNFSETTLADPTFSTIIEDETLDMIGFGVVLHLF